VSDPLLKEQYFERKLKNKKIAEAHQKFISITVQYMLVCLKASLLGSLLITEEFHRRIRDNSSTISTIPFEQPTKTFSSPYIFKTLNCSIVLYIVRVLNL